MNSYHVLRISLMNARDARTMLKRLILHSTWLLLVGLASILVHLIPLRGVSVLTGNLTDCEAVGLSIFFATFSATVIAAILVNVFLGFATASTTTTGKYGAST